VRQALNLQNLQTPPGGPGRTSAQREVWARNCAFGCRKIHGGHRVLLHHFCPRFAEALQMALAVYPDARVEVTDRGVTLHPSRPPIPERRLLG
jgi:hypothetical protein